MAKGKISDMTKVDFYILAGQQEKDRLDFCCRLTEKAWIAGHQVLIYAENKRQAEELDEMLWQFKPESFIPHGMLSESPEAPVAVCYEQNCEHHHDVLINLHPEIPSFFSRFGRLCEIVIQSDDILTSTREHFRYYKERGYPLKNTDMRMVGLN